MGGNINFTKEFLDTSSPPVSRYRTKQFLREHVLETFGFYHPSCVDKTGGFFHYFKDDGRIYNEGIRDLVSSTRFVFIYAMTAVEFEKPAYLDFVQHGLDFINNVHFNAETGGYAWVLDNGRVRDDRNHCYGLAFVLLANAVACKAGLSGFRDGIDSVWNLLERHYWEPENGLYKDEINGDFSVTSPYRGQNANMHMCEAMLAAYEATAEDKYLDRAYTLADSLVQRIAEEETGLIWEHYDSTWHIDLEYNKDNPKHLYRPWGFLPGHQTEWSKLLCILYRHRPEQWMIERAQFLFQTAVNTAWDEEKGGISYTFAPDMGICDSDKYYWVHAESFAAAALLFLATGNEVYRDWYDKIWRYCDKNMIDHKYGAWYRILNRDNNTYNDEKSPAGKTDYHTLGACFEVLKAIRLGEEAAGEVRLSGKKR